MGISEGTVRRTVLTELAREGFRYVPVGISVRHVHLSQTDLEALFGAGYMLHPLRDLSQPGQYAARETVTLKGPKGRLEKVRIIGPVRRETQAELSLTDAMSIGMKDIPIRMSGDLERTPEITIEGPAGTVTIAQGAIVAARHLHLSSQQARVYGLHDGQVVHLRANGQRSMVFEHVICRAGDGHELEFHIDTDEANACALKNGDILEVLIPGTENEEPSDFVPERIAKRVVYALTGREGRYSDVPLRSKNPCRSFESEKDLLELVTEQDVNIAAAKGIDHIDCCKKALITPAAFDRAAQLHIEIVRKTQDALPLQIGPADGQEILELVTANELNTAFRDNRQEIFCTEDALITPAAQERIQETGIRVIRLGQTG